LNYIFCISLHMAWQRENGSPVMLGGQLHIGL